MTSEPTAEVITQQVRDLGKLSDDDLYRLLSQESLEKYRKGLMKQAVDTLSPERRRQFERDKSRGAGLYGPISFLFGKVDHDMLHVLVDSTKLQPNAEDGKGLFALRWGNLKRQLCEDWHYCEKRKEYADPEALCAAMTAVAVNTSPLQPSIAAAVVLLASRQGPKFICDCPDEAGAETSAMPA